MRALEDGPVGLRECAERWVTIKNTARPSPNTRTARIGDLAVIGGYLSDVAGEVDDKLVVLEPLTPADVTLRALEDAFAVYATSHKPSSTRRVMSTWRQFCLWLVRERLLDNNPLDHIETPRRTPWVPKPIGQSDLAAVAAEAPLPYPRARHWWPERDLALLALLLTAGTRASELIGLELGDLYLDDDPPRVRVHGKGDRERTIPLPPEAVDVLRTYLRSRRTLDDHPDPSAPLLVRADGRAMTRSALDHAVTGWFRRAGRSTPRGARAHSFRHTFATGLLDNGVTLREVQELLGHADLGTTQGYTAVTAVGLAQASLANPARGLLRPAPR